MLAAAAAGAAAARGTSIRDHETRLIGPTGVERAARCGYTQARVAVSLFSAEQAGPRLLHAKKDKLEQGSRFHPIARCKAGHCAAVDRITPRRVRYWPVR